MFNYIHKNISNTIKIDEDLSENFIVGTTWEDYLKGEYILLNEQQVAFVEANPQANHNEIFHLKLTENVTSERTLMDAKREKLNEIEEYDNSSSVNIFKINNDIEAWFTMNERSNYSSSIKAAKLLDIKTLSFFVGSMMIEIPTDDAETMLAQIQLYADSAFIVTKQHKINVENMTTIEDVDNYDYTVGYPEILNFQIG